VPSTAVNTPAFVRHLTVSIWIWPKALEKVVPVPRSALVVDDHPAIREAICELFTRDGDFDVCGQTKNGRAAIEKAPPSPPRPHWGGPFLANHEWLGGDADSEEALASIARNHLVRSH